MLRFGDQQAALRADVGQLRADRLARVDASVARVAARTPPIAGGAAAVGGHDPTHAAHHEGTLGHARQQSGAVAVIRARSVGRSSAEPSAGERALEGAAGADAARAPRAIVEVADAVAPADGARLERAQDRAAFALA